MQVPVLWRGRYLTAARFVVLVTLTFAFLATFLQFNPLHGDRGILAKDVEAGDVSTVYVDDVNFQVYYSWSVGPFTRRQGVYDAPDVTGDTTAEFESAIERQLGHKGVRLKYKKYDAFFGIEGISIVAFASYPLFLKVAWLRWLTVALGLLLLVIMLSGAFRRATNRAIWPLLAVLTGIGFFSYIWSEPRPLMKLRRQSIRDSQGVMSGYRAIAITAVMAVFYVTLGYLIRFVLERYLVS